MKLIPYWVLVLDYIFRNLLCGRSFALQLHSAWKGIYELRFSHQPYLVGYSPVVKRPQFPEFQVQLATCSNAKNSGRCSFHTIIEHFVGKSWSILMAHRLRDNFVTILLFAAKKMRSLFFIVLFIFLQFCLSFIFLFSFFLCLYFILVLLNF